MLEYFQPQSEDLAGFRSGPLGPHLESFATLLANQHYCDPTGWRKVRLVASLSQWLAERHRGLAGLSEQDVDAFLKGRWKKRPRQSGDHCTLTLLLQHLREIKVVAPAPPPAPISRFEDLISHDYEQFLLSERGFRPGSADHYLRTVHRFLSDRFPQGKTRLERLRAQDVIDFVYRDSSSRGHHSCRLAASALRSFLSFLFQTERMTANLAVAVPKVAVWRSPELPRYLEVPQVEKVLCSCDRRRRVGKRDYAILLLLARLGLRAGEVVNLTLDDINWSAGELRILGKGPQVDQLPLLQDVGQALADYLQKGRPVCSCRQVFIQSQAPYAAIASPHTISALVQRALARANLHPSPQGAHLLRHSLATRMIRSGASLTEIGRVLRHHHSRTTEIYAKVDLSALRALAQPWPGGGR